MSWVFLWGEKMPLPTAAELTDPNATNSQMKQRLGQLAENVESKDGATTKANAAKTEAIATAATDATTKANAAKTEAIATAATDATTKANAAKTEAIATAATDATTKANAAKTEAIATAATDATTKANAAQAAAITAAQADATTKANTAEANAKDYTDANIETIAVDVPSVNMFNKDTALLNTHINAATGATYSVAGYFTSDWIPIKPNHTYSTRSVFTSVLPKFYQYDANKNFISSIELLSNSTTTSTTAPNAAYLRVNGSMSTRLNDSAVYDTNYAKQYQEYEEKRFLDLTNHVNLKVAPDNLNFITQIQGSNLVDPNKGTSDIIVGATGAEATQVGYWTTDFIPVKPNTVYSRGAGSFFAEYDENKQFIKTTNTASITTDVNTKYIRSYFTESQRAAGQAFITEGISTRSQPYSRNIVIDGLRTDTTWLNKKMLWLGTSIPNGAGYPESVADNMGMLLNKKTLSGGNIRAFNDGGVWQTQSNLHFMFTLEKADVNSRYGHMLGKTVKSTDYLIEDASGVVLTQEMLDHLTRSNYEQLLLPYIAETDLFVIDYGINDSGATTVAFEPARTAGTDRSKFAGAFGFLINKILQAKPSAVIIIVGHFVRYGVGAPTEYVVLGQEDVASYYGLPFMNIAAISGVNSINRPTLVPDNIHPPKDGVVAKRYVKYIVEKLRELTHGS